jgi:hypothetical protein
LNISKKGIGAHLTLDNLFPEPYVAPFAEAQYVSFDWQESQPNDLKVSGSTAYSSAFRFGLSLQLNWLDPKSALAAQESSGMENAFIDVFVSQYSASTAAEDPNFQTGMNYGGGLRLEF